MPLSPEMLQPKKTSPRFRYFERDAPTYPLARPWHSMLYYGRSKNLLYLWVPLSGSFYLSPFCERVHHRSDVAL